MKIASLLRNLLQLKNELPRKIKYELFKKTCSDQLKSFKDIHLGERCFLIGNAPSLKHHDLRKLIHEKTFVSNMFVLHNLAFEINPTYYCIGDWLHWSKEGGFTPSLRKGFEKLNDTKFFLEYDAKKVASRTPELSNRNAYYLFQDCSKSVWNGFFNTDISQPIFWGRTVIIDFCIPLACYMGFSKIYLLGMDYDYHHGNSNKLNFESTYFYDIKNDDRKVDESEDHKTEAGGPERIAAVMKSFEVVNNALSKRDHHIYNAGYGGKLEIFPRVCFDDLF